MQPSAGLLRVEVFSLWHRANFKVANPLRGSARIVRVEKLSLWPRANFQRRRRTFLLFSAGASAGA